MAPPRIELADHSAEGQMIAEALRALGFYVVERSLESLAEGTDAALLVLAGDVEGAMDVLSALRRVDATAMTPVVLLGAPPSVKDDAEARALGADAFYARPVSVERLVRKVETYLSPRESRLRVITTPPEPESASIPAAPERTMALEEPSESEWEPRERTMDLGAEGDEVDDALSFDDDAEDSFVDAIEASFGGEEPVEVTGVSWRGEVAGSSDEVAAIVEEEPEQVSEIARISRPPSAPSAPESTEGEASREIPSVRPASPSEELSPRLAKLFSDADRRVFPDSDPLDLVLPAGQEPALALVPDELLDAVPLPPEPEEEDPLEAFTYVGFVPEIPSALAPSLGGDVQHFARTPSSAGVVLTDPSRAPADATPVPKVARDAVEPSVANRPSRPPLTHRQELSVEMGTLDTVGEVAATDDRLEPSGKLGDGDVLALLFRIASRRDRDPVDVHLALEGSLTLLVGVRDGELVRLDGPVMLRALELLQLARRTDITAELASEAEASAALSEAVRSGRLDKFELDRTTRRARESLLAEALAATSGTYSIGKPLGDLAARARLLSKPLARALVEAARQKLVPADARRVLGGGSVAVVGTERVAAHASELGIEPEIESLLVRHEGKRLDVLLDAAPADEGLAGLVLALVAMRLVRVEARESSEEPREAAARLRALVRAAASLAEDGHYFAVLGVAPTATPRELRDAYEMRRAELADIDLAARGLDNLAADREEALRVLDEAYEVLSDRGLAARYAAALELGA